MTLAGASSHRDVSKARCSHQSTYTNRASGNGWHDRLEQMQAHSAWFAKLEESERTDLAVLLLALLQEAHRIRLLLALGASARLRIGYDEGTMRPM
jgi:hypothetical protein